MESIPTTLMSFTSDSNLLTRFAPMKPAAPVTSTVFPSSETFSFNIFINYLKTNT